MQTEYSCLNLIYLIVLEALTEPYKHYIIICDNILETHWMTQSLFTTFQEPLNINSLENSTTISIEILDARYERFWTTLSGLWSRTLKHVFCWTLLICLNTSELFSILSKMAVIFLKCTFGLSRISCLSYFGFDGESNKYAVTFPTKVCLIVLLQTGRHIARICCTSLVYFSKVQLRKF